MKYARTKSVTLCALFASLIAIGAYIRVPIPPLPITLQAQFALLSGMLLGARRGLISALIYMAAGLAGLPVFTEGGGLYYVLKPSFGYIMGFAAAAYAAGKIARKPGSHGYGRLLAAGFAGLATVYLLGGVYFYLITELYMGANMGLWQLMISCVLLPLPGDAAMCFISAALCKRMLPLIGKYAR